VSNGDIKVFGRFNALDFAIVFAAAVALAGFFLAKAGHAGVNSAIEGNQKISIDIYFMSIKTEDVNLFKIGEKSALTIRNQPVHPPMLITAVKHNQKQVAFLSPDGKKAIAMDDLANPLAHDFVVTLQEDAEVTADGYVVRGNKLKVGNQVEMEGFKYRAQGVVVDVRPADGTGREAPGATPGGSGVREAPGATRGGSSTPGSGGPSRESGTNASKAPATGNKTPASGSSKAR
jgi:hypothetical protein